MRTLDQAGRAGALRWRPRLRPPRPAGIRNGGLLLVLVALAAVMALVDRPPQPGDGPRLPGIFQHLPPSVGITALPPVTDLPATPAGGGQAAALAADGERPAAGGRAHPNRTHPRPARSGSSAAGGGSGGSGTSRPPVAAPPVAAVPGVAVQVPPVAVRVRPPSVLGRDLPDVAAETPAATVQTPAVEVPRLG
jgi:hypothetical protein